VARAYLSLGANVAGARSNIDEAERRLAALPELTIVARSGETGASSGRPKQLDWVYRVVGVDTPLKARALLDACIAIEAAMGRDHADIWGPRLIDIDLLAYDDIEIRSSRLHVPHAFAHSRPYILEPLWEIAPEAAAFVERVGTRPR
jgi:2-amino-4-hydroxy-6-hydroxymethyldihydropteridine diphosphokinase